jgi:hypothetical protein
MNYSRKVLLGLASLAVTTLWLLPAQAQIAASGSNAISGSNASSGSISGSRAQGGNASGTGTGISTAGGGTATGGGGTAGLTFNQGNNSPVNSTQPSDVTVRSAPTIYVPNVVTGNVCALGASAGVSWLGAGVAGGMSWESMQCERRQTAALLWNMGTAESKLAAKAVVCKSPEVASAFSQTGNPCPADIAATQTVQAQPVQMQRPAPATVAASNCRPVPANPQFVTCD